MSKFLGLIFSLLLAVTVHASPNIEHWTTENGVSVYFVAAPELPMVDIQIVFDAGGAQDGELSGQALLTNAMLNEGADGLNADQIAAAFDDIGARFGNSSQRDMAMLSLRSLTADSALKPALDLFYKVLSKPDFPQASFDRIQKQLLLGLQAEKQSPSALASRAFYSNLYGDHVYAAMPAGNEQSLSKITVDTLKEFYKNNYVAEKATIVIVGALDLAQAKQTAEKLSSDLPSGGRSFIDEVQVLTEAKTVKIDHPSSQTHILMGQPGIKRGDADYFALYVGNHILGGSGLVSQLSNEVREKRGLTYSVYSYFRPMQQLGPYQLGLSTRNDQADEALAVMRNTLIKFIENGPTKEELIAAKQNITGGFALRVDSNSKIIGYLAMIGFYDLPLDYLENFNDQVNAVTVEQIKDAFSRRVHPDKMVTIMVGGKAE
ncbi:MAG: insulinase family protein [Methylophaga sp.]|nr:insulinase family protein [Methylophaga sp.]